MNNEPFICGCIGPIFGEPYCPCEMTRRGLPRSEQFISQQTKLKSKETWDFLIKTLEENKNEL